MHTRASNLVFSLLIALTGTVHGDFTPPRRLTSPGRAAGSFHLGADSFANTHIAHVDGSELVVDTRGPGISDRVSLGSGDDPRFAFSLLGIYLAYSAAGDGAGGREIFLVSRFGAQWNPPEPISSGEGDDRFPALQIARSDRPVLAWQEEREGSPPRIWFRRLPQAPSEIGPGERPAFVIDGSGRAHVFFLRHGDVHYTRESATTPGLFAEPRDITETPLSSESAPRVAIHDGENVYVSYERDGAVYLADDLAGDFSRARVLAEPGSRRPSLTISPGGTVALAFEKGGDIQLILGATFFLPPPVPVQSTPEIEAEPVIALDLFHNVHIAFRRDGGLYYVTDEGPPEASFTADPLRGEAPLTIRFSDTSKGDVTAWSWDFGDDATSSERNPVHIYEQSGEYVVRLQVSGPGGESPIPHQKTILVLDPRNAMWIAGVSAFPGQTGVHVPVVATHDAPLQGFTIAATYDPAVIDIGAIVVEDSNIADLHPELFAVNISRDPDQPFFTAGLLFDIQDPFDGRVIPPGAAHRIANVIVDVKRSARPGTDSRIQLKNQIGRPPLNNIFTVNGFSVLPVLGEEGLVAVRRLSFPPPRFFVRGDSDDNGLINLTDAVTMLTYLFAGGRRPECLDSTDVTDDGKLDVADAAFLLGFLFKAGSYPPPPYPDPGLDPTADALGECLLR